MLESTSNEIAVIGHNNAPEVVDDKPTTKALIEAAATANVADLVSQSERQKRNIALALVMNECADATTFRALRDQFKVVYVRKYEALRRIDERLIEVREAKPSHTAAENAAYQSWSRINKLAKEAKQLGATSVEDFITLRREAVLDRNDSDTGKAARADGARAAAGAKADQALAITSANDDVRLAFVRVDAILARNKVQFASDLDAATFAAAMATLRAHFRPETV